MKRTVQMAKGNAGGAHVSSTGCRHNPAHISRVVHDALLVACKGDKDRAASFMRPLKRAMNTEPRQELVRLGNNSLRFLRQLERVL